MNTPKVRIGLAYDPSKRPVLDKDAQRVQRALVPGIDTQGEIRFPRITPDGVVFTLCAMVWIVLFIVGVWGMIY